MKVGLVGAGRIGKIHAPALAESPEVTTLRVTDSDATRAAHLAGAVGAEVASSATDLADWADALVITAASDAHAELIHLAADAGIPAFCEKPIALDLSTTDAVLKHVQEAGIALQVGFQRRFDQGFMQARRLVASGELGWLYVARLASHDPAPHHEDYVAASGGIFRDLSIHDFDILRWTTGQEVTEIYADGSVLVDEMFGRYDDVDTAVAFARLSEGALAVFTGTRHDPRGYDVRMELFGSGDSITVGWDDRLPLRSVEPGMPDQGVVGYRDFSERFAAAYRAEITAFLELAQGKTANPCSGEEAREALRIAIAADISRQEHRPVRMDEMA